MNNYELLIRKLDEFIRKYYKNLLIRGSILFVAIFGLFFLVVILSEYVGRFGTLTRTVMFYTSIAAGLFVLVRLILLPAARLFRLGGTISHEEAAGIIGTHFPEVRDKLLNTLQLKKIESESPEAADLIRASIDQKIEKLKPVPFRAAIETRANLRYLRYALPPLLILLLLFIAAPSVITGPAERIVKHKTYFEEPQPFTLTIQNEKLEGVQQEDYTLVVAATGDAVPEEIFLQTGNSTFRLTRNSSSRFSYTFRNIQENLRFVLTADRYRSQEYTLRVVPRPIVLNFAIHADYPSYTGKADEEFENTGDMVVPQGTSLTWSFYTRDTKTILMNIGGKPVQLEASGSNVFIYKAGMKESTSYSVVSSNEFIRNSDSLGFTVSVIPDAYPSIAVEQVRDSVYDKRVFFMGDIRDDYGFSSLSFNYSIMPVGGDQLALREGKVPIPVSQASSRQQFFHYLDVDSLDVSPGEEITYYFEVWDNDGVNGPKSARSQNLFFKAPTLEEIDEKTEESAELVTDMMEKSMQDARELQKKIDELNRRLLEKENLGWQEQQQVQELLDQYKQIQQQVEELRKENEIKSMREEQYDKMNDELARKQEQLDKLINEVLSEDMKKMIEELQQKLDEIDKEKVNEMLEKMKMDSKELEKELDRNLELFKQLEFEKKLQDAIDKLNDLQKRQEELSEKTEKEKDTEKAGQEQEKLNEEFDKLRKDLDELEQKNKELEEPNALQNTDQQEEEIQQEMNEGMEQLQQGKSKNASSSQRSASQKMKQLSSQLSQMQDSMYQDNLGEDIESLREILENLLEISFDQESLMDETREVSIVDPRFVSVVESQKRIRDDLVMVEDSLWALSKRQQMIEPYITSEIGEINRNMDQAIENLNDRNKPPAGENQQYVMTSVNNLALMLSETLRQMEQNLQMQCSGQCSNGNPKPGQGKPSMKSMRQLQQQLNSQLQQMKDGMKKGENSPSKERNSAQSEQFARMAAQQEAIRRMMDQYNEGLQEQGYGNSKELQQLMEDMEKNETELVNKMITEEMMQRLENIETRLLKHEKAELKREMEEKRESRQPKNEIYGNPEEFLEYNKLKTREVELFRSVPPNLKPFYKEKVNNYFYNFEINQP